MGTRSFLTLPIDSKVVIFTVVDRASVGASTRESHGPISPVDRPRRADANAAASAARAQPENGRLTPSFLTVPADSYRYLSPATGSERAGVVLDTVGGCQLGTLNANRL
jgi:hypothetical protein